MQWTITPRGSVTVLAVNGFIAGHHVERLLGAVRSADRTSSGPLIVDLTAAQAWSPEGEQAMGVVLRSWADKGRRVVMCVPAESRLTVQHPALATLDRCQDLDEALVTCQAQMSEQ
jgi:hypothetical protein